MKIAVVSSSINGYASRLIEKLNKNNIEVLFIHNMPPKRKKNKFLKKIFKVGFLGVLIGFIYRQYYKNEFKNTESLCKHFKITFARINNFCIPASLADKLHNYDLGISMGNGYIPPRFYKLFKYGMINIHHEILPEYAGAQSVVWPIIHNKKETGFSIHKINKSIDKGELICVEKRPIIFQENLADTIKFNYKESLEKSVESLLELLNKPFEEWPLAPNLANKSFTTPTFTQWIKAFYNHRCLKKNV